MATTAAPFAVPARPARRPLSSYGKLSVAMLVGASALLGYTMAFVFHAFIPPIAIFVVLGVVFASVIARGVRWAPALGALFGVLFLLANAYPIATELSHPEGSMFPLVLVAVVLGLLALAAGIAGTVTNYRRAGAAAGTPRWFAPVLSGIAGACLGAIALAAVVRADGSAATGVSPRVLATLPGVSVHDFNFEQREIRVKAGERVALRVENKDAMQHSFDVDEFDVHVPLPGGKTTLALFTAGVPGRYTFYCSPHYDKKTGEGMKGTLIVEP
jgi:plastocyanin